MANTAEKGADKTQTGTQIEDGNLGSYNELFSAKSSIKGQDGGVVSALLVEGLQRGLFDVAVVVARKEGYRAEAVAAENVAEVEAAKGTKYLRVLTAPKLRELVAKGRKRIAVVGTPCQAKAARAIQKNLKQQVPDAEITIVGLFCFEAFNYAKLKTQTQELLGINIDEAQKTQIRQGKFTAYLDHREYSCRVGDLEGAVEGGCRFCDDFSAWHADVSAGSVGSPSGYSTVIVRTDAGKRLIENLGICRAEANKEEIAKVCKLKKAHANKNFSRINKTPTQPQKTDV
jgi:coenzyme F420 hydrogenase subunit beta